MLKESIKDLINAIAEGDTLAIDTSFNDIMAHKISDRLDDMRVSVAQNMFGAPVVEESYELDDEIEKVKVPVGSRPKGRGWELHRSGQQHGEPHDTFKRTTKKVLAPSFNREEVEADELLK